METITDEHVDAEAPSQLRRHGRVALLGVGSLVVVLALALAALLVPRSGAILPGVTVAGIDLGGMTRAEATAAVADHAAARASDAISVTLGDDEIGSTAESLGYELDVEATVDQAVNRGRQSNPVAALRDHLWALRGQTTVAVDETVDGTALRAWALAASEQLTTEPIEGTIRFEGASVERIDPEPGQRVPVEPLIDLLRPAVLAPGPDTVEAPLQRIHPRTTVADVDAVHEAARRAVSGPVTLSRNDTSVTFEQEMIADALRVARTPGTPALELWIDRSVVADAVPEDAVEGFNTNPVDAEVVVSGGTVSISESSEGFRYRPAIAADQLLAVATGDGDREATLEGETVEPELTTADAEALEVVEPIASFTTQHACCGGRVQNIQLMADMVDGVLIKPGETFSINDHVGPRTREKGFTTDQMIYEGEFRDVVGGGVSQFATTMYNAAYFAGFEILEHKAHSYYISRYPAGREATLNYSNIDLKIRNSSPYGAVVKTSYTPTSITVTIWGKEWVEVESVSGPRQNIRRGSVRDGFDITVTRILRFPDGREEREQEFTRYEPEFG